MACCDYGAVIMKNGKIVSSDTLPVINEDMWWSAEMGDADFSVRIFKETLIVFRGDEDVGVFNGIREGHSSGRRYPYYRSKLRAEGVDLDIKRLGDCQHRVRFTYRGNRYSCIYGYGVGTDVYHWWKRLGVSSKRRHRALAWAAKL